jgi:hypothetical protein
VAIDTPAPRSRRAVIAAALGGLGGLVAGSFGRPAVVSADDPNDVVKNQDNATTALTSVTQGTAATDAFAGNSPTGTGLFGHSTDPSASEFLDPSHRTGVIGAVGSTAEMFESTDEVGVYGVSNISDNSIGLLGQSEPGWGAFARGSVGVGGVGYVGVLGFGFTNLARTVGVLGDATGSQTGVYGFTGSDVAPLAPVGGIGVLARAQTNAQTALQVIGKVKFNRSGRIAVAAGKTSVVKSLAGVTTSSIIIAVLQTAEAGTWVRAAVPGSGKFTVYFNRALPSSTYVGYFVIN